ncbi:MAG: hypothetical protein H5U40_08930, partial [Polyangiaceae bacterium]|nr:hypothetical protein [Polyangiaceae bacterium]
MERRPRPNAVAAPRGILGDEGRLARPEREGPTLTRITEELLSMEAGDRPFSDKMRAARNALISARGERYYTDIVAMLVHRVYPPARARKLFEQIRAHKAELARALSRDPGIHVAALDYVANVDHAEAEVARVERAGFRAMAEAGRRDPDTGLVDRLSFQLVVDRAIIESARRGASIAVIVVRLVGANASAQLPPLALAIEGACREADVAARYAPDSLALLLGDADLTRAQRFVRRLHAIAADLPEGVRTAIGVAVHPD